MIDRRCRMCGCTEISACVDEDGPCCWVDEDLCSVCQSKSEKAVAAAHQAINAVAELLSYSREGDNTHGNPFEGDVVECLLDAAKMAMEIEGWNNGPTSETIPGLKAIRAERFRVYAAVAKAIEGWA